MNRREEVTVLARIAHAATTLATDLRSLPTTCSGVRTVEANFATAVAGHARDDLAAVLTDADGYWESPPVGEMGALDMGAVWPTTKGETAWHNEHDGKAVA